MWRRRRHQDSQQACNASHSPQHHSEHQPSVALDSRPGPRSDGSSPRFDGPNCWCADIWIANETLLWLLKQRRSV
eukprot:gene19659-biopygen23507